MNGPLQEFTPDKSNYERPTHGWTCGRKCEGDPCHIGPSSGGECQSQLECIPAREGGGFICARPRAFGGACATGPLPDGSCCQPLVTCHPQRTLFARRRVVTMTCAGLALGVLLCTFGGRASVRNAITTPGALTLQHSSKIQDCKDCHERAMEDFEHLSLSDALSSSGSVAMTDSEKCIACHDLGPDYKQAHSLSSATLESLTTQAAQATFTNSPPFLVSLATQLVGSPMDQDQDQGQLACSRCHKEHRGKFFDLTKMANEQCQACHTSTFHGFNAGHPEFSDFPYSRRTRIHFDHATHYGIHFANFKRIMPNGRRPDSCKTCHQPDPSQQTMPVVDFGHACGSCHGEQLYRAPDSITFFALPSLDTTKEPRIGDWPASVAPRADGDLPTFMQLLLENDDAWGKARQMRRLAEQDRDPVAMERAQVQTAWVAKGLLHDLVQNGEVALQQRLAAAFGNDDQQPALINTLAGAGTFLDRLTAASKRWFPNLEQDLARHAAGESVDFDEIPVEPVQEERNAGWNTAVGSISYLPSGHADRTVQSLIDTLVAVPGVVVASDSTDRSTARQVYWALTDPGASFRCMACHAIDADGETAVVNWYGRRQVSRERSFNRFSHAPHITLLARTDTNDAANAASECHHCHRLQDSSERKDTFFDNRFVKLPDWKANTDFHSVGTSGFEAIQRETCAACHTQARAGESCLKCHNYHVGNFSNESILTANTTGTGATEDEEPGTSDTPSAK